jgi:2-oxoglutarate ferredoxin oxidoreductase subunit gamma
MERELMLTGIGGQGVQLAAQTLARAATLEGRFVMLLGTYGGTMRGGNTDSTLVFGDGPLASPPIVSHAWSAIAMHHRFWGPTQAKLRKGSLLLVNSTLFEAELDRDLHRVFEVPASEIATGISGPMGASMVAIAAYAKLTGLVELDSLVEAMTSSLPPYRRQHVESNTELLRAGFALFDAVEVPAWEAVEGAA